MTKTLHIVSLPRRGGLEVMFLNFLKELKNTDTELFEEQFVFALNCTQDIKKELQALGIVFYDVQIEETSKVKIIMAILKSIKKHKIDVIYGQNYICNSLAAITGIVNPKLKVITHEHGTVWKTNNLVSYLFNQFWITFSNVIICNSEATKIYINERFKVNQKKLKVILNGVPFEERNVVDKPSSPTDLVFIGRLWEIKSVETIIRSLTEVIKKYSDIQLNILGDGPQRKELEQLVVELNLNGNISFLGYVDDINQYLNSAAFVIVPSVRESLGNVVIEAAFQEVPSIASRVDGLSEVIIDYKTGRLLQPKIDVKDKVFPQYVVDVQNKQLTTPKKLDYRELAEAIVECLDDPQRTREMGKQAKIFVTQRFSMKRYVSDIRKLIKT